MDISQPCAQCGTDTTCSHTSPVVEGAAEPVAEGAQADAAPGSRRARLEAKMEKRTAWAGKAAARSESRFARARSIGDGIPFGHYAERPLMRRRRVDVGVGAECDAALALLVRQSAKSRCRPRLPRALRRSKDLGLPGAWRDAGGGGLNLPPHSLHRVRAQVSVPLLLEGQHQRTSRTESSPGSSRGSQVARSPSRSKQTSSTPPKRVADRGCGPYNLTTA